MDACRWTCEIRVCIRVMRHGRLGTINGADRLAILSLDACHVQTVGAVSLSWPEPAQRQTVTSHQTVTAGGGVSDHRPAPLRLSRPLGDTGRRYIRPAAESETDRGSNMLGTQGVTVTATGHAGHSALELQLRPADWAGPSRGPWAAGGPQGGPMRWAQPGPDQARCASRRVGESLVRDSERPDRPRQQQPAQVRRLICGPRARVPLPVRHRHHGPPRPPQ